MIRLFNRKKISINSIAIPNFGWSKSKSDRNIKQWINSERTIALSVNFFDSKPDLPTINDIERLRNYYRNQIIAHNGGLIEVSKFELKGYDVIRTIFKIPQAPTGTTYLTSLTIPFENYSYVVKIQAPEVGITGIRDNAIATKLLSEEKIAVGDNGYEGWISDPYAPEIKEGSLMNRSEEEQFDAEFPTHPLTQTRKLLNSIELEIEFGNELEKIVPFDK